MTDTQPRRMMRGMDGNEGRHAGDHPPYANCKYNGCTPIDTDAQMDGLDALVEEIEDAVYDCMNHAGSCECGRQAIRSVLERAMAREDA